MAQTSAGQIHDCGCCGRSFPAGRVAELGVTPGVFVCTGCALSAARRATSFGLIRRLPAASLKALWGRLQPHSHALSAADARSAIPILPSSDLDRAAAFWARVGFAETERFPGYLLLHSGGVELHFSQRERPVSPVECFVHVGDARQLWKRVTDQAVAGVGPITDTDYGLREFVVTDDDGNRVRFGSPAQ